MDNWNLLNAIEHKKAWDFVYSNLGFSPYEKENLIKLPSPNKCFDISSFYNEGFIEYLYENLHECALFWFEKIRNGKRMYALNWQHVCYSFTASLPFEKNEFDEWLISVFPNGDYLFFLTNDFKNGIFADGINLRLQLWGEDMIKALESKMPVILIKSGSCH